MGDRAMALVAREMGELCAQRLAPEHGVAAIAGMAEIERVAHRGNVARNQVGIAAVAVAGEH